MNRSNTHAKTLTMVQIAFLAAVEVILTLLYIPIGTINLNFGLVPIVIAGALLGPLAGCLIGVVSGIVTMIQVLTGQGVFYVFLVATNPVIASLLCVVKTGAAGLISGLMYKLFEKIAANLKHKQVDCTFHFIANDAQQNAADSIQHMTVNLQRVVRVIGTILAAALCPIVNTGIFALGMLTIFGDALMADPVISTWTTGGLFALVFIVLIGVNFFVELVSTIIIVPPLNEAIFSSKLVKRNK